MSDQSLQELLTRLSEDHAFAALVKEDPVRELCRYKLTPVELLALSCGDGDALRRLLASTDYETASIDYSAFRNAAGPVVDDDAARDMEERCGGGRTTRVTSRTVTRCCW